jgi:hypothetical protein
LRKSARRLRLCVDIEPAENDRTRDTGSPWTAHHDPHGIGSTVVATCLRTHDDQVQILDVVVFRGIDARGRSERSIPSSIKSREIGLKHGYRVAKPSCSVFVEGGLGVRHERLFHGTSARLSQHSRETGAMPAVFLKRERLAILWIPCSARGGERCLIVLRQRCGAVTLGFANHHHRVVRPELIWQLGMSGEHGEDCD